MANNNRTKQPDEAKTEAAELELAPVPAKEDEVKAEGEATVETDAPDPTASGEAPELELEAVDEDADVQMQLGEFVYLEKLNNTETAYLEHQFGYFPRVKKFWQSHLNTYRGVK